jgi:hypothetical protein
LAIDLTVEEYCSDCYDFEAEVIKPERRLQRIDEKHCSKYSDQYHRSLQVCQEMRKS